MTHEEIKRLACVRCDKPLVSLMGDNPNPETGAFDCAGVHNFVVGYGSTQYDTSEFIIGICDDCLVKMHKAGTIFEKYNCFEKQTTNPRTRP